jgi:hypothetical protein
MALAWGLRTGALGTLSYSTSESTSVQDAEVRRKSRACERLRVFGMDRVAIAPFP